MVTNERGFSLMEVMVTMAITLIIMAGTMRAMNDAMRASETAQLVTSMNRGLRTAADIMVRDMLQVGQGLPPSHVVQIPQGGTATAVKLPGPLKSPAVTRTLPTSTTVLAAVIPGPGLGPTINGVATDVVTTLSVDSAFDRVQLTAITANSIVVRTGVTITGSVPTAVRPGDLIMLLKGSTTTLVEVTEVESPSTIRFATTAPLNLNQSGANVGSVGTLMATAPTDVIDPPDDPYIPTSASRVRMISYYLDTVSDPARPRLVRRLNHGVNATDAALYDNTLGTAVAFDVENLQISYDLVDSVNNWANVKMNAADVAGSGACSPDPCNANQIRKINLLLVGRSRLPLRSTKQFFRNSITTQVSLRSLAFVDRYK
jgi:prepilin-type N-terminal cleavage/methylation domain-containing protein